MSLARLVAYWLGLGVVWGAVSTIIMPTLVADRVPADVKSSAVALIAAAQALMAIAVQPVAGALSDRLVGRWGRRRPWMVAGVSLQCVALAGLVLAPGYWTILAIMLGVEFASNAAQGPYQALLPDLVPHGSRGTASGALGAATLGGQIGGAAVAGLAVAAGAVDLAIWLAVASVLVGMIATVTGVHEAPPDTAPAEPAGRLGPRIIEILGAVWRRDLLEHPGYLWLLAGRLAVLMATGTLQPFILFYLADTLHLGNDAGPLVAPVAATVAFAAVLAAIPAGRLTARFGRVRVVAASSLVGALGAVAFAVAPGYLALFPTAVPFGVALGAFMASDWALLVDIVPEGEAGRFLGISTTVTAGAALVSVALAGPLADAINSISFGLGYRAIFVLAAVEFAIGAWCVSRIAEPVAERPSSDLLGFGG